MRGCGEGGKGCEEWSIALEECGGGALDEGISRVCEKRCVMVVEN